MLGRSFAARQKNEITEKELDDRWEFTRPGAVWHWIRAKDVEDLKAFPLPKCKEQVPRNWSAILTKMHDS